MTAGVGSGAVSHCVCERGWHMCLVSSRAVGDPYSWDIDCGLTSHLARASLKLLHP